MTSIPAAICRIYGKYFKRHYLRKKNFFPIFYCISEMCMKFKAFSKKKMSILAQLFPKLLMLKEVAT